MRVWMLWIVAAIFWATSSVCYLVDGNYDLAREYLMFMLLAIVLANQYREKEK